MDTGLNTIPTIVKVETTYNSEGKKNEIKNGITGTHGANKIFISQFLTHSIFILFQSFLTSLLYPFYEIYANSSELYKLKATSKYGILATNSFSEISPDTQQNHLNFFTR